MSIRVGKSAGLLVLNKFTSMNLFYIYDKFKPVTMKYFLALLLALSINATKAQKIENIYKTWVLSKISDKNGSELPDDNPLKYIHEI